MLLTTQLIAPVSINANFFYNKLFQSTFRPCLHHHSLLSLRYAMLDSFSGPFFTCNLLQNQ